jgi:Rrf2 family transcriptional regulator, cysteine metabolism repressor
MMKFSTKARYGLRMMIEMARELQSCRLIQLKTVAKVTGLSENYLAQLAIPLKNQGIILGVSGKYGGYRLAKPAQEIKLSEVIKAVGGPISLADCVANPGICMISDSCETRLVWLILSASMFDILDNYSLDDLINEDKINNFKIKYSLLPLLQSDPLMVTGLETNNINCPNMLKPEG